MRLTHLLVLLTKPYIEFMQNQIEQQSEILNGTVANKGFASGGLKYKIQVLYFYENLYIS